MSTTDQHFVAGRILSSLDRSARDQDAAEQTPSEQADWKQRAIGVALALSRDGHFEWEDFRQALLQQAPFGASDTSASSGETSWAFCQRWVLALERVAGTAGLVDAGALAELRLLAEQACTGLAPCFASALRPASLQLL